MNYGKRMAAILLAMVLLASGCVADGPIDRQGEDYQEGDGNDLGDLLGDEESGGDLQGDQEESGDGEELADGDGEPAEGDDEEPIGDDEADGEAPGDDETPGDGEPGGDDEVEAPEPLGDTCETAMDVTDGGIWLQESTVEMTDSYSPSMGESNCPGTNFSGRERVYVVRPDEATSYEVEADPEPGFDLMIYVRTDCEAAACVAGTRLNGPGVKESLSFEAQGGVSTYIFVDGEIGHSGVFDLMVLPLD